MMSITKYVILFSIKIFIYYRLSLFSHPHSSSFFHRHHHYDYDKQEQQQRKFDWLIEHSKFCSHSTMWKKIKEILCKHTGEFFFYYFCYFDSRHVRLFFLMMYIYIYICIWHPFTIYWLHVRYIEDHTNEWRRRRDVPNHI